MCTKKIADFDLRCEGWQIVLSLGLSSIWFRVAGWAVLFTIVTGLELLTLVTDLALIYAKKLIKL